MQLRLNLPVRDVILGLSEDTPIHVRYTCKTCRLGIASAISVKVLYIQYVKVYVKVVIQLA